MIRSGRGPSGVQNPKLSTGRRVVLWGLLLPLVGPPLARAQWPQWGGPNGDFTAPSTGLADQWPADGPRKLWTSEIGPGHSAIVCDDGVLYTMCRRGDDDAVLAYEAATGNKLWEICYSAPPKPDMLEGFVLSPHSTPLVVGDRLYTVGGLAHFHCLDKRTGGVLWSHDLMAEFGASHLGRGYGASPFAYHDLVIIVVGGRELSVAAFQQQTGHIVWKSELFRPGYPSPVLARINGEDHLILALSAERIGLDPATGLTRWKTTVDKQCAGIMSTPAFVPPDRVFSTSAYGGGSQLFQINHVAEGYSAELLWHDTKLKVMHGNVVRDGDVIYGSSGDFGPAFVMALDLPTGKILWRDRGFAKSTLLLADGKLIILDETGILALATATRDGLTVHSQVKLLQEKSWSVPTLVGTTLYLRDYHAIMALDLSAAGNGNTRKSS